MIMEREKYREYRPGMKLSDYYDPERVPLLTMQQLRQLDFPITLRISYERTCDEFLTQLAVNDMLRPLRLHSNLVILLDSQGALIREDNHWMLLFTPNRGEHLTLDENAELYPVLRQLIEKKDEGTVCQVPVPDRSMKTMVTKSAPFCILDEYCKTQPGRFLSVAERIVTDGPEELYQHVPVCHYGELTTVDKDEIENYHTIKSLLEDYIYQFEHQDENGCPAPLSVAIFGSPGSGKSFGVKQLAKSIGKFQVTSLNLSQLKEPSQLGDAMYEAVHSAPKDRIPLIFFDEFDSELNGVPRGWLKYFLAPMQDGEFVKDGRTHLVHGGVFVFAGATASNFNEFIPKEAKAQEEFRAVKGPDFVSRLKGFLNVKGPNPLTPLDRSHIIRRAVLMRDQLVRKTSGIYDPETKTVHISEALLSALLTVSEYRHGARSLNFLLDMSRLSEVERFTPSCLPVEEQLNIHMDAADFQRHLAFEQSMGSVVEKYAETAHETYCETQLKEAERLGLDGDRIQKLRLSPDMRPWGELDEFFKEGYRSQIRYIGQRLEDYDCPIGIRPIYSNAADAITELYGPVLELLAEMEHDRWMKDKISDGWKFGEKKNNALRTTPELVPFVELDKDTQEFIRRSVRHIPENLRKVGYELYRKMR